MNRWQFNVRHLLVLTTIVSFVLLFAVKWLPAFLVVCFWLVFMTAIAGFVFVTSAERPRTAVVSWLLMGAVLVSVAVISWRGIPSSAARVGTVVERYGAMATSVAIGCVGLLGFYRARQALMRAKSSGPERNP